ncbi:hypothetical protein U9M48_027803 [Paspalum notatum var. saurae]|uniref:KIB1-4 beta-propeller domain-containing protein n=1 Tax=Paspalum notatum var. saurae TaxID=547442 RepID=A0AAQ3TXY1_PASNO
MAASSLWPGLPIDLLYDISCRLHDAGDYVRLHAVCKAWRGASPPAAPAFLPWLLARSDHGDRTAGCAFAAMPFHPSSRHHRRILKVDRTPPVFSGRDGTVCSGFDLPRSAPAAAVLPRYSDENEIRSWVDGAIGRVSGDGTILLYAWVVPKLRVPYPTQPNLNMAIVRPGNTVWKFMTRYDPTRAYGDKGGRDQCCVVYHSGRIVLCKGTNWRIWSAQGEDDHRWHGKLPYDPDNIFQSGYLVETRGELLWVSVWLSHQYFEHRDLEKAPPSVSVYSMQEHGARGSASPSPWKKRDCRSLALADRVLFLGNPISFAVDASQCGMMGGCAYFILHRKRQCPQLIKYGLDDGSVEPLEELPKDFRSKDCTWLTPKPVIDSIKLSHDDVQLMY